MGLECVTLKSQKQKIKKDKKDKREDDEMGVDEEGETVPGGFHLCRATYTYTVPADCNVGNAPIGEDFLGDCGFGTASNNLLAGG